MIEVISCLLVLGGNKEHQMGGRVAKVLEILV
jgi:hypothetical protein